MSRNKPAMKLAGPATTRSTPGAGYAFEDLVAADLLSRFLLDIPIPGMDRPGTKLLSQAAAAGWGIDDLVCVAEDAIDGDGAARLAISCKSNVQVTANAWPSDFIEAAWQLWRRDAPFERSTDSMALVTRGRNTSFDATWADLKGWCRDADPTRAIARITRHSAFPFSVHPVQEDALLSPGASAERKSDTRS